jgi:argonaute-like protein implicated in RNA metabolism and viral defense
MFQHLSEKEAAMLETEITISAFDRRLQRAAKSTNDKKSNIWKNRAKPSSRVGPSRRRVLAANP